ncbi:unnamed protein product, partial [Allacma fusca]
ESNGCSITRTWCYQKKSKMARFNLFLVVVVVAMGLFIATELAEGAMDPYKQQQPPFNGGIFGKRNSGGILVDGVKAVHSWRSVCDVAIETCSSLFLESR